MHARRASILIAIALVLVCSNAAPRADDDEPTGVLSHAAGIGLPESSERAFDNALATTDLSSGVARSYIPFRLSHARGTIQPALGLHYSSVAGNREVGTGWSLNLPAIERRNLAGPPRYQDPGPRGTLDPNVEDRFVFAGEPLIPICSFVSQCPETESFPSWFLEGWHYFRLQVEGAFLRFFWSPDHGTWRVQTKTGELMEFGAPLGSTDSSGQDLDGGRVFRWNLVQQQNEDRPQDLVVYRWGRRGEQGIGYLTDIFDTPAPHSTAFADYAHHVRLEYQPHDFKNISAAPIWRATPDLRLSSVAVTSKNFRNSGPRELVRRYFLTYETASRHSWLHRVAMEGRCKSPVQEYEAFGEFYVPEHGCPELPPTTMTYARPTPSFGPWTMMAGAGPVAMPSGLDNNWMQTTAVDVNSDGLPDFVSPHVSQTQAQDLWFNSIGTARDTLVGAPCKSPQYTGCPASISLLSPVIGATSATLLSRFHGRSVLGDWFGEGAMDVMWSPTAADGLPPGEGFPTAMYAPRLLGDVWLWSGGKSPFITPRFLLWAADFDGDGLTDGISYIQNNNEMTLHFTDKVAGQGVQPFARSSRVVIDYALDGPVVFADMNGDGLPDMVLLSPGDRFTAGGIIYWTGDGQFFQVVPFPSSHFHQIGGRVPRELAPVTYLHDVNGDGLADLIRSSDAGVDVFFNVDGDHFGDRHHIVWPFATRGTTGSVSDPELDNYTLTFADMNGSGVDDIVLLAQGHPVYYIDLFRGETPNLLTEVANGLGASTQLTYASTPELARLARATGTDWQSQTPQVVHVVTSLTNTNNLTGGEREHHVTQFSYRDPVYDGWERRFLGFRQVRQTELGDGTAPQSSVETTFLVGACMDITVPCGANADESSPLKYFTASPVVSEVFDGTGRYLETKHWMYRLADLYTGMDGRKVRYAKPFRVDTFVYDTANFDGTPQTITIPDVDPSTMDNAPIRDLTVRATAGRERLRTFFLLDDVGDPTFTLESGRIRDDESLIDPPIIRENTFDLVGHTGWSRRLVETRLLPFGAQPSIPVAPMRRMTFRYDGAGNLQDAIADLTGTVPLDRFHEDGKAVAPTPASASRDGAVTIFHGEYDAVGNLHRSFGAAGLCEQYDYDDPYGELVVATRASCADDALVVRRTFDRGLAAAVETTLPDGTLSRVRLDGFGRLIEAYAPDPRTVGSVSDFPTLIVEYRSRTNGPMQWLHVQVRDSGPALFRESWVALDGFGRPLATFRAADKSAGDGGDWVVSGLSVRSAKGLPARVYLPQFYSGRVDAFPFGAFESGPHISLIFDAFDRLFRVADLDGTLASAYDYHALSQDVSDAVDLQHGGPQRTPFTYERDGHGRVIAVRSRQTNGLDGVITRYGYLATGELALLTQEHRLGPERILHWMQYDSLGRLTRNGEPNTSHGFVSDPEKSSGMKGWRYAYDDASRLVGTSDARGCGENLFYDALSRMVAEDYSPCLRAQPEYTPVNLADGSGAEVFARFDAPEPGQTTDFGDNPALLLGRLTALRDRGTHTRYAYDGRGRLVGVARRLARPTPAAAGSDPYTDWWFRAAMRYDEADRLVRQTTGADVPELLGAHGKSEIRLRYTRRGLLDSIRSSYGVLLEHQVHAADGLPLVKQFGDAAHSFLQYGYDARRRLRQSTFTRPKPGPWVHDSRYTPPASGDFTMPQVLEQFVYGYDAADNPIAIDDQRNPAEWPAGAAPQPRAMIYDDLYRLVTMSYAADDVQVQPFAPEIAKRDIAPAPALSLPKRVRSQTFQYDWNGNLRGSDDDAHGFYDRSLGAVLNGDPLDHPNQLRTAAAGGATLGTTYDDAGNLVNLVVARVGSCTDPDGKCTQRYDYDWDEVGRLVRSRRWDYAVIPPGEPQYPAIPLAPPSADLRDTYGGGRRVLRSATDEGQATRHSAEIFATLRLDHAAFDDVRNVYVRSADTEVVYPTGFARLVYSAGDLPSPHDDRQHIFLRVADHIGSTSTVIDRNTGELVEQMTYQAFGAAESDFRPARWGSFRDQDRFNGKDDDIEVGLSYFGARYYHPLLQRWISPDPLAIAGTGSDPNPYAFVHGAPERLVDANGLDTFGCDDLSPGCNPGGIGIIIPFPIGGIHLPGFFTGSSGGGSTRPPRAPDPQPEPGIMAALDPNNFVYGVRPERSWTIQDNTIANLEAAERWVAMATMAIESVLSGMALEEAYGAAVYDSLTSMVPGLARLAGTGAAAAGRDGQPEADAEHLTEVLKQRANQIAAQAGLDNTPSAGTVAVQRIARPIQANGATIGYEFKDLVGVNSGASPNIISRVSGALGQNETLVLDEGHAEWNLVARSIAPSVVNRGWLPVGGGVAPNLICTRLCSPAILQIGGIISPDSRSYWFPGFFKFR